MIFVVSTVDFLFVIYLLIFFTKCVAVVIFVVKSVDFLLFFVVGMREVAFRQH